MTIFNKILNKVPNFINEYAITSCYNDHGKLHKSTFIDQTYCTICNHLCHMRTIKYKEFYKIISYILIGNIKLLKLLLPQLKYVVNFTRVYPNIKYIFKHKILRVVNKLNLLYIYNQHIIFII